MCFTEQIELISSAKKKKIPGLSLQSATKGNQSHKRKKKHVKVRIKFKKYPGKTNNFMRKKSQIQKES